MVRSGSTARRRVRDAGGSVHFIRLTIDPEMGINPGQVAIRHRVHATSTKDEGMTATMTGPPLPPEPPQPSAAEVAAPKRNLIFTAVLPGIRSHPLALQGLDATGGASRVALDRHLYRF